MHGERFSWRAVRRVLALSAAVLSVQGWYCAVLAGAMLETCG